MLLAKRTGFGEDMTENACLLNNLWPQFPPLTVLPGEVPLQTTRVNCPLAAQGANVADGSHNTFKPQESLPSMKLHLPHDFRLFHKRHRGRLHGTLCRYRGHRCRGGFRGWHFRTATTLQVCSQPSPQFESMTTPSTNRHAPCTMHRRVKINANTFSLPTMCACDVGTLLAKYWPHSGQA